MMQIPHYFHYTTVAEGEPRSRFKRIVSEYSSVENAPFRVDQVNDFIDNNIGFDIPSPLSCKHILLVYEEIELARQIEMRYLRNRLKRGETCACLARSEGPDVDENALQIAMGQNEIDVDQLVKTGQLRIKTITDSEYNNITQSRNPKTASEIIQSLSDELWRGRHPPYGGFGIIASEHDLMGPSV